MRRKLVIKLSILLIGFAVGVLSVICYRATSSLPSTESSMVMQSTDGSRGAPDKEQTEHADVADPSIIRPCEYTNRSKEFKVRPVRTTSVGIVNWRVVCGPTPFFPDKNKNLSGRVFVNVLIDAAGEVVEASSSSGQRLFFETALHAARRTRFTPALLGGQPIRTRGVLIYEFDRIRGVRLAKDAPCRRKLFLDDTSHSAFDCTPRKLGMFD